MSKSWFTRVHARLIAVVLVMAGASATMGRAQAQVNVPDEFQVIEMSPPLTLAVAMAIAPDGRIFIAQRSGIVKVVQGGSVVSTFIDLSDEVNCSKGSGDRGMLGIALDPNFLTNRRVYLLYAVDPILGLPDENGQTSTFSRVTRYTGTEASNGNIADTNSRDVLVGDTAPEGIPSCASSHSTGALRFGTDGSLLVSHGEGARFGSTQVDSGGLNNGCFVAGMFDQSQNIGAFRAQMLDSLAGKVLRINPEDGVGLPGNPYFNPALPASPRSRIWVSGLRNPFRFNVRPGTGGVSTPGTLYIGDVGWDQFEELSVSRTGGENFAWPCFEAHDHNAPYQAVDLPPESNWDCDTINTTGNPGPRTNPILSIHHFNQALSLPMGLTSTCIIAGVFHVGSNYPSPWRGGFFFADHFGWIQVLRTNALDQVTGIHDFGSSNDGIVDFAIHPPTGDLCILTMWDGIVYRVHSLIRAGDVNRNGVVNINDLLAVVIAWGPCANPLTCPADLNVSGQVDINDLLEVIINWG